MESDTSTVATGHMLPESGTAGPLNECHILRLPRELREDIYDLTFDHTHESIQKMGIERSNETSQFRNWPSQPALSKTCTQLRHEVLSRFYGTGTWMLHSYALSLGRLERWITMAGPVFKYLRSILITLWTEKPDPVDLIVSVSEGGKLTYKLHNTGRTDVCDCIFRDAVKCAENGVTALPHGGALVRLLRIFDCPKEALSDELPAICEVCSGRKFRLSFKTGMDYESKIQ
jgi:hypothetical protein